MRRFSSALWSLAVAGIVLFGIADSVNAQQQRSAREIRDAVRTLNSQVDDLQYNIEFEMKNNGGAVSLRDADSSLRDLKEKLNSFDQNVTARRENRDDINEIITAAKGWRADLIVLGTHGRRGLKRLVMGSDAELLLRHSPVPVLMVRDQSNVE